MRAEETLVSCHERQSADASRCREEAVGRVLVLEVQQTALGGDLPRERRFAERPVSNQSICMRPLFSSSHWSKV